MYYVYVLKSKKDGKFYTGFTEDLKQRFAQHNKQEVASTRGREPFELVYYEASLNKIDALNREKYLKSGMGKRYIRNRIRFFLSAQNNKPR
jgi:putative endonuclease